MADPSGVEVEPRAGWSVPVAFGRGLTLLVVLLVLTIGGFATALLSRQAQDAADNAEADLSARVGRSLTTTGEVLVAGFSGSAGLVRPDGSVEEPSFAEFADGVVAATGLITIGYETVVTDADRAEFEVETGAPIKQAGPTGLVAAARRDQYLPVRRALPASATSPRLIGYDIASDPVRAAAADRARDSGVVVFSEPIVTQPDGVMAFFVVQALYRSGAPRNTPRERQSALAGFVSSVAPGSMVLQSVLAQLPAGARARITDGDKLLAETPDQPHRGHRASVEVGGRPWLVTIDRRQADLNATLLMGSGTIAVAALTGLFLARNHRQTRELREAALDVRLLGRLSEQLAGADTQDEVADIVGRQAAPAVGADSATIVPVPAHGADWPPGDTDVAEQAVRLKAPVYQIDAGRSGGSVAAIPLRRQSGEVIGVLCCEWTKRQRFRPRRRATLEATAEICQQSLIRAGDQETRRNTANALSQLGQRLSIARSLEDVADEVVRFAPAASGATVVAVGFCTPISTSLRVRHSGDSATAEMLDVPVDPRGRFMKMMRRGERVQFRTAADIDRYQVLRDLVGPTVDRLICLPLTNSAGQMSGVLAFVYASSAQLRTWSEPGRLKTITDLTAQTVERAQLYQHQHELVLQLQQRTLPQLVEIPGLQVAARYLPSSSALGLGGDWYDVQHLSDGRAGLVVGDVVGHGIDAIADMTEIRTTVSTLLRTNTDLATLSAQSTALLAGDGTNHVLFATAMLMIVDTAAESLSYARAGHPPALVRRGSGEVMVLAGAGTTPIGISDPNPVEVEEVPFARGSLLVVYTDGLIERRGEDIDAGIDRLTAALLAACADPGWDVEGIADGLVEACLGGRATEDDAALLLVAFR